MFKRGSEWGLWDVHVHTPLTYKSNNYSYDLATYLANIEKKPEFIALGITEYLLIDSYEEVWKAKHQQGRIPKVQFLFPNLEFRITPENQDGFYLNIHLLIDSKDPNHIAEIRSALTRLSMQTTKGKFSCTKSDLVAFGRALKNGVGDDTSFLKEGINEFKVEFDGFREWYEGEKWLKENSIVAISGKNDGLGAFKWDKDGGWNQHKTKIIHFCPIIFSSNKADRDFWLGITKPKDIEVLGGTKPCLHGCDAHCDVELLNPAEKRFCWIKATPSFEGLKQACMEPAERVWIGEKAPDERVGVNVIDSVEFGNSTNFFGGSKVEFNKGLVAIIGQRGTGKTALAEAIALASDSIILDDDDSFLKRAGKKIFGTRVLVNWLPPSATAGAIKIDDTRLKAASKRVISDLAFGKVKYLSQNYVEKLCSKDVDGVELVKEIETIIFNSIDSTGRLNSPDFDAYKEKKISSHQKSIYRTQLDIQDLNKEESELSLKIAKKDEVTKNIAKLVEEKAQIDAVALQNSQDTNAIVTNLTALRDALGKCQAQISNLVTKRHSIEADKKDYLALVKDLNTKVQKVVGKFIAYGLAEAESKKLLPKADYDVEAILKPLITSIDAQLVNLRTVDSPTQKSEATLKAEIVATEATLAASTENQMKIIVAQQRLSKIKEEIAKYQEELGRIDKEYPERITAIWKEREEFYVTILKECQAQHDTLKSLYSFLEINPDISAKMGLTIRLNIEFEKWFEKLSNLFDLRKSKQNPFKDISELEDELKAKLLAGWSNLLDKNSDSSPLATAITSVLKKLKDKDITMASFLKEQSSTLDILNLLFDTTHLKLQYSLAYEGVELLSLSPGTKGVVLLLLYLALDTSDTRPLIIDQPEGNLDSESVYSLLSKYFREAKRKRQIIIVTHNPNLVVNTDAEQVIVVKTTKDSGIPTFTYDSGPLEDAQIREDICRIMEGGKDAFNKRNERYTMKI